MFSCCHAAVAVVRFMRWCVNAAGAALRLVFEFESFIVVQVGSGFNSVMLSFFFFFFFLSFQQVQHTTPQYADSAETVTWRRQVIFKVHQLSQHFHLLGASTAAAFLVSLYTPPPPNWMSQSKLCLPNKVQLNLQCVYVQFGWASVLPFICSNLTFSCNIHQRAVGLSWLTMRAK